MKQKTKSTLLLAMLIIMGALISCVSTELQYRFFVLRSQEKKLNAPKPADDLPITVCDDTIQSKANCYVILRDEYSKMRRDMVEKEIQLKACQKN